MKKLIYSLGGLVFFGYLVATCFYLVNESEFVLISQFGKVTRSVDKAGFYFKIPDPIQSISRYDKRLNILNLTEVELGTRDRRNVVMENVVLWKITDPLRYRSSVREDAIAEQRLESLVYSEVGAAIGAARFNNIFSDSNESQLQNIFSELTDSISFATERELGIEVIAVRPVRTSFPQQNLLPIYKRMESQWTRRAKQLRAEGNEEAAKIRSETEKEVRELSAKAYKESQIIIGEGEAKASRLYAEAFEENQEYYEFSRKMEAYKRLFNKDTKIILSTDNPIIKDLLEPPASED